MVAPRSRGKHPDGGDHCGVVSGSALGFRGPVAGHPPTTGSGGCWTSRSARSAHARRYSTDRGLTAIAHLRGGKLKYLPRNPWTVLPAATVA